MKHNTPLNWQAAGLAAPGTAPEDGVSAASMKKLRIFKDHVNETPVVVIFVGQTTYDITAIPVNETRDFIALTAAFVDHDIVLAHINFELLPNLELLTQLIGARIYVLDEVPDLERTPSEMMAVGGYRHHVDLADYLLLISGKDLPDSSDPESQEQGNDPEEDE